MECALGPDDLEGALSLQGKDLKHRVRVRVRVRVKVRGRVRDRVRVHKTDA